MNGKQKVSCILMLFLTLSLAACSGDGLVTLPDASDGSDKETIGGNEQISEPEIPEPGEVVNNDGQQADLNTNTILQKIYTVNETDKLLKNTDTIALTQTWYNADSSPAFEDYIYITADRVTALLNGGQYVVYDRVKNTLRIYDPTMDECYQTIYSEPNQLVDSFAGYYHCLGYVYEEHEQAEEVLEDNGQITVKSYVPPEYVAPYIIDMFPSLLSGDQLRYRYLADAESLTLNRIETILSSADGTEYTVVQDQMDYDISCPEAPEEFTAAFSNPETRTFTAIFDPGTEQERIIIADIPKGVGVNFDYDYNTYPTLYADEACTELFEDDYTCQNDVIVYLSEGQ